MLHGWQAIVALVCIFIFIPLTTFLVSLYEPKKTYLIDWYIGDFPKFIYGTDIVKARNISRAWRKVQKKHFIPVSLLQFKEIR